MDILTEGFSVCSGWKPSIDRPGYAAQIGFNRRLVWEGSLLYDDPVDAEIEAEERLHERLKMLLA